MNPFNKPIPSTFDVKLKKGIKVISEKKIQIISFLVLGIIIGAALVLILPKKYKATANVLFKYNSVYNSLLSSNGTLDNEISSITSQENYSRVVATLENKGIESSVSELYNNVKVTGDNSATSLFVDVIANDDEKSAVTANSVVAKFREQSTIRSKIPLLHTLKYIQDRLKEVQSNTPIPTDGSITSSALSIAHETLITRLAEFESELENVEIDNQFYIAQINYLVKTIEDLYPNVSENVIEILDTDIDSYKLRVERLQAQENLSSVKQKLRSFTINYPWIDNFKIEDLPTYKTEYFNKIEKYVDDLAKTNSVDDVNSLKEVVVKLQESKLMTASYDLTKTIIFNVLTNLEDEFNRIPFASLEKARQIRASRFQNKLVIKLRAKELKFRNEEKQYLSEIDTVIEADVPDNYFSPSLFLFVFLGGMIGFILGIILALKPTTKQMDLVTNMEDLEDAGFRVIAQIPSFPLDHPSLLDFGDDVIMSKLDPTVINSFEGIEAFLRYGDLDKPMKNILVTSKSIEEGKSLVAMNISMILAKNNSKVLLVDLDLKTPKLNTYFKVSSSPSLAHYLFRKKELDDIIRNTHLSNLKLITCIEFPQNPNVIITSERMRNFIEAVSLQYDYVVYDTSSLDILEETLELSPLIDEVILVTRSYKTRFDDLLEVKDLFHRNGLDDFSVVLNDIKK